MKRLAVLCCIVLILAIPASGPAQRIVPSLTNVRILVQGNNAFALDLHARLRSKEGIFLLPFQLPPALPQS